MYSNSDNSNYRQRFSLPLNKSNRRRNRIKIQKQLLLNNIDSTDDNYMDVTESYDTDISMDTLRLSDDILEKCREAFRKFDTNGDGQIAVDELKHALLSMGYSPTTEELDDIMNVVDENSDNKLSFLEFIRVIKKQRRVQPPMTEEEVNQINIKEAWRSLSDGSSTKMDVEKFKDTLRSFNLALDVDTFVQVMDVDGNNRVDFEEFRSLMTSFE